MIGYLKGQAIVKTNHLILLVNGVGYKVAIQPKTLSSIKTSQEIGLHIYTHVKENILELYGFIAEQELQLFKLVLSVSGVGPKTAIMLTNRGVNQFIDAVQNAKVAFFTKVPRVGKKLAQKIIIDLRSKLGSLKELNLAPKSTKETELIEALESLGFDSVNSEQILEQIDTDNLSIQEAIKKAMRLLSKI